MRFYVTDDEEHKIYLSITAGKKIETRDDLKYYYDVHCEKCRKYISFSRNDIIAEQENGKYSIFIPAITGAFMFGMVLGLVGIIIGGIIFGILGIYFVSKDEHNVEVFNSSEGYS